MNMRLPADIDYDGETFEDGKEPSGVVIAAFARRHRRTHNPEQIRISVEEFEGRKFVRIALWYLGTGRDRKFWPARESPGFTARAHELADWTEAMVTAARMINGESRPRPSAPTRPAYRPTTARAARKTFDSRDQGPPRERADELPGMIPVAAGGPDFDEFG
jgi:hypothetical protein